VVALLVIASANCLASEQLSWSKCFDFQSHRHRRRIFLRKDNKFSGRFEYMYMCFRESVPLVQFDIVELTEMDTNVIIIK